MAISRPPRRPLFALVDAVLQHPNLTVAVTVVLWVLERLLGS